MKSIAFIILIFISKFSCLIVVINYYVASICSLFWYCRMLFLTSFLDVALNRPNP